MICREMQEKCMRSWKKSKIDGIEPFQGGEIRLAGYFSLR
jgi:hypothetical protein